MPGAICASAPRPLSRPRGKPAGRASYLRSYLDGVLLASNYILCKLGRTA